MERILEPVILRDLNKRLSIPLHGSPFSGAWLSAHRSLALLSSVHWLSVIGRLKKPQNTEIKHINGQWYLYERFTKYDPKTKKSRKLSGRLLGKITKDGFIPRALKVSPSEGLESLEYGASQYFYEISQDIMAALRESFPDEWKTIYVASILRTIYGTRLKRLAMEYEDSFLSLSFPDLKMSGPEVASLFKAIGKKRSRIRETMSSTRRGARPTVIGALALCHQLSEGKYAGPLSTVPGKPHKSRLFCPLNAYIPG